MHLMWLKRMMIISEFRLRSAAVLLAAVLLLAVAAPRAQAGFPGDNGLIVYENSSSGQNFDKEIWAMEEIESGWRAVRLTADRTADEYPAVSPNGKEIAFSSRRNTVDFPNPEGDLEIYIMDAKDDNGDGQGDNLRRLTNNAAIDTQPAWSPGGKKLAISSNRANLSRNSPQDIYVIDAEGWQDPIRLPRDPANTTAQHPVVSPDGEWVVFVGGYDLPPTNFDLFMTRADGSGEVIQLTNTIAGETHPEFSPDGTKLAFVRNLDATGISIVNDIYVMNAAPEGEDNVPANLTEDMVDAETGAKTNERIPAWSPDGETIALWSGLDAGTNPTQRPGIWLIRADGTGEPVKITNPLINPVPIRPDWGPAPAKKHASAP